jgi:hypothetical protein
VVSDDDAAQDAGASADVDMTAQDRDARLGSGADRHLLKQQAVWPNLGFRMHDHSLRMRQQQSATQVEGVERDVGARDDGPEAVPRGSELAHGVTRHAAASSRARVVAERPEQPTRRVPPAFGPLARPVRLKSRDLGRR